MGELRNIGKEELQEILRLHELWMWEYEGGERADLSHADLTNINLNNINICGADLSGADLSGTHLSYVRLRRATLRGSVLRSADLEESLLTSADLSGAVLRGAVLRGADLDYTDLQNADLREAQLWSAGLDYAKLQNANLRGANLGKAHFNYTDLSGVKLCGADLSDAQLLHVNLDGADLQGAILRGANLCGANLSNTDLYEADLEDANLHCVTYNENTKSNSALINACIERHLKRNSTPKTRLERNFSAAHTKLRALLAGKDSDDWMDRLLTFHLLATKASLNAAALDVPQQVRGEKLTRVDHSGVFSRVYTLGNRLGHALIVTRKTFPRKTNLTDFGEALKEWLAAHPELLLCRI